jgi:hypothetical protein
VQIGGGAAVFVGRVCRHDGVQRDRAKQAVVQQRRIGSQQTSKSKGASQLRLSRIRKLSQLLA